MKGTYEYYNSMEDLKEGRNCIHKQSNLITDSGVAFMLDFLGGVRSWLRNPTYPGSGDEFWHTDRYFRVGTVTDTNSGVEGPSSGTPKAQSGDWQGVDPYDWHLSEDTNPASPTTTAFAVSEVIRAGNQLHFVGTLTGSVTFDILEIGLFLGPDVPGANPLTSASADDRKTAMFSRSVNFFLNTSSEYEIDPVTKTTGVNLYVKYVLNDFARGG